FTFSISLVHSLERFEHPGLVQLRIPQNLAWLANRDEIKFFRQCGASERTRRQGALLLRRSSRNPSNLFPTAIAGGGDSQWASISPLLIRRSLKSFDDVESLEFNSCFR
ncbi:unnamed protein product, partial [Mycena citricolor]